MPLKPVPICPICGNNDRMIQHKSGKWVCHGTHDVCVHDFGNSPVIGPMKCVKCGLKRLP